jgi:hypothetical protein
MSSSRIPPAESRQAYAATKPTRRRALVQPATGIDRAALLMAGSRPCAHRAFERALQGGIVAFHASAVVNSLSAILFAVPNGEARPAATAALLSGRRKRHPDLPPETDAEAMTPAGQGVLAGVADLVLLLPGGVILLLEVKPPKSPSYRGGVLSRAQQAFRRAALALGHEYHLVQSVDQYHTLLASHGVALRAVAFWPLQVTVRA